MQVRASRTNQNKEKDGEICKEEPVSLNFFVVLKLHKWFLYELQAVLLDKSVLLDTHNDT